jgi:hypothetical protein
MNDPTVLKESDRIEVGRKLGYDLFRFGRTDIHGEWRQEIAEGFAQASARGGIRVHPDRFINKWLQLRISAYSRDRIFDEQVTPEMIRKIDVAECPILRIPLTHGTRASTDWSVDRLNNDGAYATHNLAVMSTLANEIKGNLSFDQVYEYAQGSCATNGLEPVQWLRLASVMLGPCYVDRKDEIPTIPLAAPIPLNTARFPTQIIQQLFTLMAHRLSDLNSLVKHFKKACRTTHSKERMRYLLDRMHFALKNAAYPWDIWLLPRIMQAYKEWQDSLDATSFEIATSVAISMAPVHQFGINRIHSWNLKNSGYTTAPHWR